MKKLLIPIILFFIFLATLTSTQAASKKFPTPQILKDSKQLIAVVTPSWNSPNGKLWRFKRGDNKNQWMLVGKPIPVILGKSGLGWSGEYHEYQLRGPYKKEGDFKSPAGVFDLGPAFGFDKKMNKNLKIFFLPITKTTICVHDPRSKYYGRIIDSDKIEKKDWRGGEEMINYPQYRYGVMVDYNMGERIPEIGSCIFLHIATQKDKDGTQGCTAVPSQPLKRIMKWLNSRNNPILVQMPILQYQHLQKSWKLPTIPSK